ncbi:trypsin-like peptidase domain-containing protein [Streptomyces sp. WMMC500]|uniref:S1C family serine protease n=1 Tax=Streptomyces sp. WMMC500 TaxID=3015154 RepID=UPI00248BE22A|nr:trypsin-like peptidase domain-containing protein [Streptomyces sp. WMMC500]WBB58032.1 trypsin-like peptidase domain-containing protein [Streptomyces sp. WMMC500]
MSTENDGATPPRPDFPPPDAGARSPVESPERSHQAAGGAWPAGPEGPGGSDAAGSPGGPGAGGHGEARTEQFAAVGAAGGRGSDGDRTGPAGGQTGPSGAAGSSGGAGPQWPPPPPPAGTSPAGATPAEPAGSPPPTQPGWGSAPPPGGSGWESGPRPPGNGGRRVGTVVAATLVAALIGGGIGGGIGYWAAEDDSSGTSTTVSGTQDGQEIENPPGSVAAIADNALPSVVTLEAGGASGDTGTGEEGGAATGTGFVYDKQGHILTNNHVVAGAEGSGSLTATFSNGKTYDAEVVGQASGYDVAVIKLTDASDANLTPLPLGDSDKVDVGDQTIAIGSPFGLSGTVTTGIVSAKNRPVASGDASGQTDSYMNALQTDASINPGNSGGPLLDHDGNVVGINSAIRPADSGSPFGGGQGGSIGLGFAIPINQADRVAQDLIDTGEPVYAIIGVSVDNSYQGKGAKVSESGSDAAGDPVTPGGPAADAGLQPGDVITRLDDTIIDSGPTLIAQLWAHKPGDTVEITYERGGDQKTVDITLGEREGDD